MSIGLSITVSTRPRSLEQAGSEGPHGYPAALAAPSVSYCGKSESVIRDASVCGQHRHVHRRRVGIFGPVLSTRSSSSPATTFPQFPATVKQTACSAHTKAPSAQAPRPAPRAILIGGRHSGAVDRIHGIHHQKITQCLGCGDKEGDVRASVNRSPSVTPRRSTHTSCAMRQARPTQPGGRTAHPETGESPYAMAPDCRHALHRSATLLPAAWGSPTV